MSAYLGWLRAIRSARTAGSMRPLVQLNFVAQQDNVHELHELVELCDREDVAGIHVFHLNAYDAGLREQSLFTDPERARSCFEQAMKTAARLGVFLHLPPLDGQARSCRQPFEHLFIRHDGRVRGCCSAAFEPGLYGLEVGDLSQNPADLWRAPILEQFRAASEAGRDEDLPRPCQSCSFRLPELESHLRPLTKLPTLTGEPRVGA
jgi:MoaA/NifB/PqqE/SkfB family radical SAM enzyme